jgi:threonylcarbamoyladenosine tRNA methylthiotransferase MtaB
VERTFAIKDFGCKVNQYESQVIRENLRRFGFSEKGEKIADVVVINSCTVTAHADTKTRKYIKHIRKHNPGVKIIVTGCYAVDPEDVITLEGTGEIHAVVPNRDKMTVPNIVKALFSAGAEAQAMNEWVSEFDSHTRAFVKIQDGCDHVCAYCKVRIVRGPSRSRDKEDILNEIKRLSANGYREIVLTGICLGSWRGKDGGAFSGLVREIEAIDADIRVRLSSLEPDQIDEELLAVISSSRKICRHFHIPLQSGSDRILALMKRRYTAGRFELLVEKIRGIMPDAGITMDIISGFPQETDVDFQATCSFIEKIRPSRLHVFSYSDRKGTLSSSMPGKVGHKVIKDRVEKIIKLGEKLQHDFAASFLGREVSVLIEGKPRGDTLTGYTSEYVQVSLRGFEKSEGEIVKIIPTDIEGSCPVLTVTQQKSE